MNRLLGDNEIQQLALNRKRRIPKENSNDGRALTLVLLEAVLE